MRFRRDETLIPPKKNRKEQRDYDKYLYKMRHLVESCFLVLKRWRGIITCYAKTLDAFIAAVHVRCIAIWFSKTISLQRQIFQVICTSPRPTRILSISASTTVSLSSMSILSQSFIYPLMVSMFRFPYISADI